MATAAPSIRLGAVAPQEAIAVFAERGLLRPSFNWQDVWQQEHSRAFAVAGVTRLDILQSFRDGIDEAVKTGLNPKDFRDRMQAMLEAKGWWGDVKITDPATGRERITHFDTQRLQLIYDVNLRQSYAAGQWAAIERNKRHMPFVAYRTMRDERVRASHKPWDGVVLPVDHPFWRTHYPPNGWRCRCTAFAVSEKDLQRMRDAGLPVKTEAPDVQWVEYVNPHTGEVTPVPRGIDPGFGYNAGLTRDARLYDQALAKAAKAPPMEGAQVVAQALRDHPGMLQAKTEEFAKWSQGVLERHQVAGETMWVGAIKPEVLRALADRRVKPASSAIAVRDADVVHARQSRKSERAAPPELYAKLPELIERASGVLWDRESPGLLYVVESSLGDGSVVKLVVKVDYLLKTRPERGAGRVRVPFNIVRTATLIDPNALLDQRRFDLLWGVRP